MTWWKSLSDAHVKFATLFEKLATLGKNVSDLSEELVATRERLARLEGRIENSSTPEILRQLSEIDKRVSRLEFYLSMQANIQGKADKPPSFLLSSVQPDTDPE